MADRFTLKRSPGKSESPRSAEAAAERIAVIIEAAERAATGVIDDAEKQARRYMEDSQRHADRLVVERLSALSEITESLALQAEAVKSHADRLVGTLEDVRSQIEGGKGGDRLDSAQSRRSGPAESIESEEISALRPFYAHLQPVESPFREEASPTKPSNDSPEARLLATQMAISGSSRSEIDACLRNELGVEDPTPLLDAILGREA